MKARLRKEYTDFGGTESKVSFPLCVRRARRSRLPAAAARPVRCCGSSRPPCRLSFLCPRSRRRRPPLPPGPLSSLSLSRPPTVCSPRPRPRSREGKRARERGGGGGGQRERRGREPGGEGGGGAKPGGAQHEKEARETRGREGNSSAHGPPRRAAYKNPPNRAWAATTS